MSTKVKSVRVDMGDCVNTGDTLVINNSCRFSTAKLPTKVSDLANDCCYLTEEALSCAVCVKADKTYVDCCLGTKQDCGNYALNCDLTSGLNSKQDVINDLSTIRANACCGKAAHTTIGTYGDIVTHDACEFQEAGDYALNCTMTACLACKYDASNPCCYQTATEVACTVSPKADKTYVDCCIGELENDIEQLQGRGKFLSNWDATTGKPETDPETLPYEYHTGDYYMVTVVGSSNKRPTGSSYTGEASTTAETSELAEGDMYAYDGTNWLLQSNHGKTVSFANLSGVPSDNACLCSELASKQDNIDDLNTIRTNACCGKSASDTIATYGDVVTHNACEFQVAGDYATNSTLESCLACKQNNISDLDTIRTNACCGACAKTIISGYGDIVSHNASEFQAAGSYAQCCDLTTGLSGKVDKVNGINRIYGTDGSGCQTDYAYSDTVTGNSVAKRDACGNLCVADPTCNSHAATKGYVDDKVDNKVICWGSIAGTLTCQTDLQTALNCKQDNISDLNSIRIGAGKGDTAVQPGDLAAVATSGKYCDLTGIPCTTTGGTAIAVSNGQVSVCYDNNTIKVNNSDQIYADYTGLQKTCNLVTNFSNADDTHYPSAKAVADIVEGMSGGNMIKEIYDPCNCRKNIYDMDNMYDGSVNKVVTATEKSLWDAKQEALTLPSNPTCGHLVVWGANKKTFVDGGEIPNSATWGCITGTLSNQTDLQNALNCKAQCCDIPTDNCQLANSCGYTTCTGTVVASDLTPYAKTNTLCAVATSGQYCDLTGTPTIPTDNCQLTNGCNYVTSACVNVKKFTLSNTSDLTTAQAAYDWYLAGNTPILVSGSYTYILEGTGSSYVRFVSTNQNWGTQGNSRTTVATSAITLCKSSNTINCIATSSVYSHNFLETDRNYSTPYTPQYDGSPATKKYVDDHDTVVSATAPETPSEGMLWYDTTNDVLKTYDGSCWNSAGGGDSSNVKVFYLSGCGKSETVLAEAQAAYDWYLAGKNPILVYNVANYFPACCSASYMCFISAVEYSNNSSCSSCDAACSICFPVTSGSVTAVCPVSKTTCCYLNTNYNYSCPYMPKYDGSPTTKKYVDDKVYTGDTAPVTAVEGQIWSDTCSNMVKYYDGSQWNVLTAGGSTGTGDVTGPNSSVDGHIAVFDSTSGKIIKDGGPIPEGKTYTAGTGICIEDTYCDYSAMRGPAPEGYHIPSAAERQCITGLIECLGISKNGESLKTYLKMPLAGYKCRNSGYTCCMGTCGFYWSTTPSPTSGMIKTMGISSSCFYCGIGCYMSEGHSIRAFKDIPVAPDNSRTTLYDGSSISTNAGIFHSIKDGLISISSDGETWVTIADKNIGATTVYDSSVASSGYNSGCFFQRGNNYGFDNTSQPKICGLSLVDGELYGPGNPYCCCVFSTTVPRACCYNNMWGNVTGAIQKENVINNSGVTSINAGTGIQISHNDDYSAMRGPTSEGYHIGLKEERESIGYIFTNIFGLSLSGTTVGTYLKLPIAGYIGSNGCCVGNTSIGYYWTPSVLSNSSCCSYNLMLDSSSFCATCSLTRTVGANIRAFKDSPVIPDSTWTTLYDGSSCAEGAGVFWNSSKGLISISGDGYNWITMADKNTGATIVYNYGDTISGDNSGCHYQRGNNYGFPFTGILPVSTDTVDASAYGPCNPYCCCVVINGSMWDCSNNGNLWGRITGISTANNLINNSGVLSVNGEKGNINIKTINGSCLIGTGNLCIKAGDAGLGICMGQYDDYSAMRGPALPGFHIPDVCEWQGILDNMTTLGLGIKGAQISEYLKIPYSPGYRHYSSGSLTSVGATSSRGHYWTRDLCCSVVGCHFDIFPSSDSKFSTANGGYGYAIRAFKDCSVIPDSNRIELYADPNAAGGTLWPSGIYHNPTLGLISISGDGDNWITIADRNVGATTVYNYGDTHTCHNIGCYFQRGNNYGFNGVAGTTPTLNNSQQNVSGVCASTFCCCLFNTRGSYLYNVYPSGTGSMPNLWGCVTGIVSSTNTISNTGVLSVNGQTGNITIQSGDPATVVSGDSGCTYTIKVSNTAPAAGTPATTITFVTA